MKHCLLLIIFLLTISSNSYSQNTRHNPHAKCMIHTPNSKNNTQKSLSNDTSFDVNFYHLAVSISIDSAYIKGSVSYLFTSRINGLSSLILDLDSVFVIDSVTYPVSSYTFSNKELTINFDTTYNLGDTFSFTIHYQGSPDLAGGYKGLRYETHNGSEPIIASLSTPYLAHTWWPCKDGLHDKADSTFIDITIKDTIISSLPVIAVSNGLLDTVITNGSFKTFKWKHFYPIVPYYVMVAISNYQHFQQTYVGSGYTFPMDYYVFDSHLLTAQNGVAQVPDIMDYFTSIFGPYPFRNEKYSMSQLGYYGGIENQTNSIVNNLSLSWLNVTIHELAHQWFADMITCETWNHAWLNEGFASYAEALYEEHQLGFNSYKNYMTNFEYYGADTLYLNDVSDPFNLFQTVIYNKGAYVLHMLRGVVGDSSFFNALYDYTNNSNHQYAHANTENLQQVFEIESGQNLDYFFSQWVYDERYPRYRYNFLQELPSGELGLSIVQTQSGNGWRNIFAMPMEIKFEFTDLTDTVVKVFNNSEAQNFSFIFDKEVSNVILDPDKWILKNAVFDSNINVDISEVTEGVFEVYPNPANHKIYIKSEKSDIKVTVFDLNGQSKLERSFKSSSTGLYLLNVEDLSTGIYIVKIKTENTEYIKKVSVIK
jgi:aminopeptidase N